MSQLEEYSDTHENLRSVSIMSRNASVWMFRVRVRKKQEYLKAAETQSDEIIIAVRHCECEVGGKSLSPPAARPLIFTQPHSSHPPFRWEEKEPQQCRERALLR